MTYVMWRGEHFWNVSKESPFTILFDFTDPNYTDLLVKDNACKASGEKMVKTPGELWFII
jgi:hypothetical protein